MTTPQQRRALITGRSIDNKANASETKKRRPVTSVDEQFSFGFGPASGPTGVRIGDKQSAMIGGARKVRAKPLPTSPITDDDECD